MCHAPCEHSEQTSRDSAPIETRVSAARTPQRGQARGDAAVTAVCFPSGLGATPRPLDGVIRSFDFFAAIRCSLVSSPEQRVRQGHREVLCCLS